MIQQIDTDLAKNSATSKHINTSLANGLFKGEWVDNNVMIYTSELTLNNDGTFKFHDQGCTEQRYTEGRWLISNGGVVLSSFDKYKQVEKVFAPNNTVFTPIHSKRKNKQNIQYVLDSRTDMHGSLSITTTPEFKIPGPNDTTNVYFDNIKLQWGFGGLFCFDKSSPLGGSKFTRAVATPTVELSPWFGGRDTALPQTH